MNLNTQMFKTRFFKPPLFGLPNPLTYLIGLATILFTNRNPFSRILPIWPLPMTLLLAIDSAARQFVTTLRSKRRLADSAKFVLLWLLMGWVSVALAQDQDAETTSNLDNGLIAYWSCDEITDNTLKDESDNGHDGIIHNVLVSSGKFEKACFFEKGENPRYIEIIDHADLNLNNTSFTLSAWIKRDKQNDHTFGVIVEKRTKDNGWGLSVKNDGKNNSKLQYEPSGHGNKQLMLSPSSSKMSLKKWYHVAFVFTRDNGTGTMYINGSQTETATLSPPDSSNNASLMIGRDHDDKLDKKNTFKHPHVWHGSLDELRIYSRALSSSEIAQLYRYDPLATKIEELEQKVEELEVEVEELKGKVDELEEKIKGLEGDINDLTTQRDKANENLTKKKQELEDAQAVINKLQQKEKVRNSLQYITPKDGIENQELDVDLSWSLKSNEVPDNEAPDEVSLPDEVTYKVYFETDQSKLLNSTPICQVSISSCEIQDDLDYGTRYYWQLVASYVAADGTEVEVKGAVWDFKTIENQAPKSETPSPEYGSLDQPINVNLAWTSSDPENDPLTYAVYLWKNGEKPTLLDCGSTSLSSCNLPTLEYGIIYFWRVDMKDGYENTRNSEETSTEGDEWTKGDIWTFRTVANEEPTITKLFPCDDPTPQELNTTLSWNATDAEGDTMTFNVYLDGSPICENISNMTCAVPNTLSYGAKHFWYVEVTDSYGNFTKSKPCGFQTKDNQPPYKASNPVLKNGDNVIDPAIKADKLVDPLQPLEFSWQGNGDPENDEVTYQACYANLSEINLEDITPDTTIPCVSANYKSESTATLPTGKLEYDTEYAWLVSVKDSENKKSDWDIWQFKTKPAPVNLLLDARSGYANTLLKWTISNNADVHSYRILRAKREKNEPLPLNDEAFEEVLCDGNGLPNNSCKDNEALSKGTEYCYRVEALDNKNKTLSTSNDNCVTFGVTTLAMKNSGGLKGQQVDVPISLLNGGGLDDIVSCDIWLGACPRTIYKII